MTREEKELREKVILLSYELHDNEDISTERLLQMVADDCLCDISDVIDVLIKKGVFQSDEG